jgi:hypothetical protein
MSQIDAIEALLVCLTDGFFCANVNDKGNGQSAIKQQGNQYIL